MNQALEQLAATISGRFAQQVARVESRCGELTFEVESAALLTVCQALRDEADWSFEQLIDLCGVDYSLYGVDEWNTETATFRGFSRGVNRVLSHQDGRGEERRFAVVYHLLSVKHNRRLRLRVFCEPGEPPMIDSVIEIWKAADWFEREAWDLMGVQFRGHPRLVRILTHPEFVGHALRKDYHSAERHRLSRTYDLFLEEKAGAPPAE